MKLKLVESGRKIGIKTEQNHLRKLVGIIGRNWLKLVANGQQKLTEFNWELVEIGWKIGEIGFKSRKSQKWTRNGHQKLTEFI